MLQFDRQADRFRLSSKDFFTFLPNLDRHPAHGYVSGYHKKETLCSVVVMNDNSSLWPNQIRLLDCCGPVAENIALLFHFGKHYLSSGG